MGDWTFDEEAGVWRLGEHTLAIGVEDSGKRRYWFDGISMSGRELAAHDYLPPEEAERYDEHLMARRGAPSSSAEAYANSACTCPKGGNAHLEGCPTLEAIRAFTRK